MTSRELGQSLRRLPIAITPACAVAMAAVAAALATPVAHGQTTPTPLARVLAMPVSPGSVALLVMHAEQPDAVTRLTASVAHSDPAVRAAAARAVFVRGVRSALPSVAAVLAQEMDPQAAFEQSRALSLAAGQYDPVLAAAAERLARLQPPIVEPPSIARLRDPASRPLFQMAGGYPPDLVESVTSATGCNVDDAALQGGAAEVTLRADGRVADVAVIPTNLSSECAEAALALFAIYTAHLPRTSSEGERRLLMLPLRRPDPACRVDPAVPQALAERIGSDGIRPPRKILDVTPAYPLSAQRDRVAGIVILETVIASTGCVASLRVVRGVDRRLDWASLVAVSQWRYTPALVGTTPTAVLMSVTTNFTLR